MSLYECIKSDWCGSITINAAFVSTNIGVIPVEDYFDIVAMQYGFDSYEDLLAHGFYIDFSEEDN